MALRARQYRDLAHAVQLRALILTSLRAQHSHHLVASQGGPQRRITIKGEKTLAELAQVHDVHTTQIVTWKAQLLEGAAGVFSSGSPAPSSDGQTDLKTLHAKACPRA